jgi:hypothetical protein
VAYLLKTGMLLSEETSAIGDGTMSRYALVENVTPLNVTNGSVAGNGVSVDPRQ